MHPLLLRLDLPPLVLPLRAVALVVAVLGVALAAAARRDRAARALGLALTGAGLGGALLGGGRALALGALTVTTWGALLAVGLIAAWRMVLPLAERGGLDRDRASGASLAALVAGLVGARALHLAVTPGGSLLGLQQGGLALYGGVVGGILGAWLHCRRTGAPFPAWADAAAPAFGLALAVGRLGCWLTGCDHGRPLADPTGPLAGLGTFPRWTGEIGLGVGSPAWVRQVEAGLIGPEAPASLPVHPVQLHEALAGLGLLWLGLAVRRRGPVGAALPTVLLAYAGVRFGLELLRDDAARGAFGPWLPPPVAAALGLAALGALAGVGPARLVAPRWRAVVRALLFVPAAASWVLLRRGAGADAAAVQLSAAQWCALGTALAAALGWDRLPAAATPGGTPAQ